MVYPLKYAQGDATKRRVEGHGRKRWLKKRGPLQERERSGQQKEALVVQPFIAKFASKRIA
jgi:hypothetical protein